VILGNSFRNLSRVTDKVVIIRDYYQGLFLKKPPLTPQKLFHCTTLLRSLVSCLVFLRFNGRHRGRSQSFDGRNAAVSSTAGAGRVEVVDLHRDVSRVNETPSRMQVERRIHLHKSQLPLAIEIGKNF